MKLLVHTNATRGLFFSWIFTEPDAVSGERVNDQRPSSLASIPKRGLEPQSPDS